MCGWVLLACLALAADVSLAWRLRADSGAGADLKFHDRAHMIADIVNRKQVGWKAAPHFVGWSEQQLKRLMGVRQGGPRLQVLEHSDVDADALPESFDARAEWPACPSISYIRDQSNCGSCWAFGAAEAITDRVCIASGGKFKTELSADDLLACCSSCGMGCDGGFPAAAWEYWVRNGLVTGANYGDTQTCLPYPLAECEHHVPGPKPACQGDAPTPQCRRQCSVASYPTPYNQDKHFGKKAYSVSSRVEQIQTELMTHGPVEAAFTVFEDFLTYKSGVYRHVSGGALGGHAVRLLGWGVENGTPYWLLANSWNSDWGDGGYFKILRGSDECGIEDEIVAGLP
jgi:cathepsin B